MVFIYGSYHWDKKDRVFDRAYCSICGRENRPVCSYTAWEVGQVMFVPLMPWGRIRVVGHCLTCKQFYKFSLKGRRLKAATDEQRTDAFAGMGQDINQTLADLAGLAHLGDFEGVQSLLDELANQGKASHALAEARFLALQGDAESAKSSFLKSLEADPSFGAADFWFGRFLLVQERDEEAIAHLQRAAALNQNYECFGSLEDFVQVRKQQKNWDGLATIMAEMARLQPDMTNDRRFGKLYSKACRKSGRDTMIANPYAGS